MLILVSKFHKINIFCSLSSRFSPSGTSLRHRREKLHPSSLSSDWVPYTTGLLEKVNGPVTHERMKYNNSALQILWPLASWAIDPRGHEGERNNCFSKIQLVGQKYRDKTTLASKTRFSRHCLGFQSPPFSLLVGYNRPAVAQTIRTKH